tara:strand:- start:40 stop:468 length:429 start_codon:yes stop_codon:yes gene_type:complete
LLPFDNNNSKKDMRKITECGVILFNQDMYNLLIVFQHQSKKWGLPKGYMTRLELYNKEYFKCAKRELLEETGIDLRIINYTKYGSVIIGNKLFFVIEIKRDYIESSPLDEYEIEQIQWIKRKDLNLFVRSHNCNITLNSLFN